MNRNWDRPETTEEFHNEQRRLRYAPLQPAIAIDLHHRRMSAGIPDFDGHRVVYWSSTYEFWMRLKELLREILQPDQVGSFALPVSFIKTHHKPQ